MTAADLETVHAIDVRSFPSPWSLQSYQYELTNPSARHWVAELDDQVIGSLIGWLIVDEFHIATVSVDPDVRRKGIGRALVARALADMRAAGAKYALLEVRSGNLAAQSLYERFGFKIVGVRAGYYRDNGEDAKLMTAELRDRDKM